MEVLFNRIAFYRKLHRLSQTELGKICGVSKNTVSSWELNTFNPSLEAAFRLSRFFNVPITQLFYFQERISFDE